jgi:hypothetical protein
MKHSASVLAVMSAVLLSPLGASARAWPSDAAGLARAVAEAYASEERGVIAFDVVQNIAIRTTLLRRDDVDVTAFVQSDGAVIRRAVLRHVEGGRSEDRDALMKREAEPESPLGRFGMRLPCDAAALPDYTYDSPIVDHDRVVLPFRARVRDQSHGDGRIVIDSANDHIESIDYVAAVPPARATSVKVTINFGSLSPERYGIVRIARIFDGHVGPFHGRVTSTALYTNFRLFSTIAAAVEAIERERRAPSVGTTWREPGG